MCTFLDKSSKQCIFCSLHEYSIAIYRTLQCYSSVDIDPPNTWCCHMLPASVLYCYRSIHTYLHNTNRSRGQVNASSRLQILEYFSGSYGVILHRDFRKIEARLFTVVDIVSLLHVDPKESSLPPWEAITQNLMCNLQDCRTRTVESFHLHMAVHRGHQGLLRSEPCLASDVKCKR